MRMSTRRKDGAVCTAEAVAAAGPGWEAAAAGVARRAPQRANAVSNAGVVALSPDRPRYRPGVRGDCAIDAPSESDRSATVAPIRCGDRKRTGAASPLVRR